MKLTIEFNMDNAAFEDDSGAEAARILRKIAADLDNGGTDGRCMDYHGNGVGEWEISGVPDTIDDDDMRPDDD